MSKESRRAAVAKCAKLKNHVVKKNTKTGMFSCVRKVENAQRSKTPPTPKTPFSKEN